MPTFCLRGGGISLKCRYPDILPARRWDFFKMSVSRHSACAAVAFFKLSGCRQRTNRRHEAVLHFLPAAKETLSDRMETEVCTHTHVYKKIPEHRLLRDFFILRFFLRYVGIPARSLVGIPTLCLCGGRFSLNCRHPDILPVRRWDFFKLSGCRQFCPMAIRFFVCAAPDDSKKPAKIERFIQPDLLRGIGGNLLADRVPLCKQTLRIGKKVLGTKGRIA